MALDCQLFLVTDDEDEIDDSIREFLRCGLELVRLSTEGTVTDRDLRDFEAGLRERWKKIERRVRRMSTEKNERDQGYDNHE